MRAPRPPLLAALLLLGGTGQTGCTGGDDGPGAPPPGAVPAACQADQPHVRPRLRRLTRAEFDNTIADLLGVPSTFGASFPPDDVVAGFDNNGAALRVGPLLADKLFAAAEALGAAATADLDKLVPCPRERRDAACAHAFVASLGRRAFRRPLTAGELDRHRRLYDAIAADDGFAGGLAAVIAAMVQSPSFLYRTELGAAGLGGPTAPAGAMVALTDHEIATELSYLLWATMPDADLLSAADAGSVHTPEQIATQARRLLASPRSRATLDRFAAQWLSLDAVLLAPKDAARYPDFTDAVRSAMRRESLDLFERVVHREGGRLPELFVSRESIVEPALARFYGLGGAPLETLPDGSERWDLTSANRGGLLTHGSVLASQAKPDSASPVHRGKLVRERLLCGLLPPPPAGFNLQLAPVDPNQQNRARFTQHASDPTCASCHRLIDPIGFGFERYDAVGRYR